MRRPATWVALSSSILAIGLFGCGGNDDESESVNTTGESGAAVEEGGGAATEYADGACVGKSKRPDIPIPTVVDCDDPAAIGVLEETDNFSECAGQGFHLGVLHGEEIDKSFCVETDGT